MIKIEKNKEYTLTLMPNYHDLQNGYEEIMYTVEDNPNTLARKYFMYVLNDGKMEVLVFGSTILKFIKGALTGHYTSENGDFVSTEPVSEYLINDEGDVIVITPYEDNDVEYYLEEGYTIKTDVKFVKPINPFDVNKGFKMKFQTIDEQGFMRIVGMEFIESTPIYKEGDDKEAIIKLYDDVPKLADFVQDHIEEMKSLEFNFIFGDEAKEKVYKNRFEKT